MGFTVHFPPLFSLSSLIALSLELLVLHKQSQQTSAKVMGHTSLQLTKQSFCWYLHIPHSSGHTHTCTHAHTHTHTHTCAHTNKQNSLLALCDPKSVPLLILNYMFRTPLWVCVLRISVIENMTRQLDLASFSLQADCGYCSYYRPQDESTTRSEGCSSHFHILSAFVSHKLLFSFTLLPFFPPFYRFHSS